MIVPIFVSRIVHPVVAVPFNIFPLASCRVHPSVQSLRLHFSHHSSVLNIYFSIYFNLNVEVTRVSAYRKMDFMSTDFDLAENIFYFHNAKLQSLGFVLDWDTKEKFYVNLLRMSFADVFDIPNDHSMVLARPGQTNYFHKSIPAFDIRYIEDCFKIKDYPDPTKYLIKNTSSGSYTKDDIFDCWFYQTKSWSDLISIPEKSPSKNSITQVTSSNDDFGSTVLSNRLQKASSSKNSNDDFDGTVLFKSSHKASSHKHTRIPYSHKEEMNIINYIIKNNYALDIKGRAMWQQMEHDNVCKLRTWQSMKERYLKSIKYDLNSGNHRFPHIKPKDLKLLRQGLNIEQINKYEKEAIKSRFNEERIDNLSSDSS
ncbi:uncharacterized protein LOC100568595 isoform X2 [Acyrthosiphon pisum]|uniref:Telomeric repeat-binding factor 2-interacting protein 1 n=1 Tax=Acyrthosiphon pisum TaxID=7029 RepID=A0A8R2ABH9_ACYPI|nr:uncharacterized protein LOC100568595 isoform X2 [Acyrthosiphon pisum]|eukprot:XP_003246244.1 PREDICTED: uncharacterized protein LOC100568595 isoform X2 [Acyrthosiphon pisum]